MIKPEMIMEVIKDGSIMKTGKWFVSLDSLRAFLEQESYIDDSPYEPRLKAIRLIDVLQWLQPEATQGQEVK